MFGAPFTSEFDIRKVVVRQWCVPGTSRTDAAGKNIVNSYFFLEIERTRWTNWSRSSVLLRVVSRRLPFQLTDDRIVEIEKCRSGVLLKVLHIGRSGDWEHHR